MPPGLYTVKASGKKTFCVSVSSVVKWAQRKRATGSCAPARMGGHRPKRLVGTYRTWLVARTAEKPFTLRGLACRSTRLLTGGKAA
jgi:transposase